MSAGEDGEQQPTQPGFEAVASYVPRQQVHRIGSQDDQYQIDHVEGGHDSQEPDQRKAQQVGKDRVVV